MRIVLVLYDNNLGPKAAVCLLHCCGCALSTLGPGFLLTVLTRHCPDDKQVGKAKIRLQGQIHLTNINNKKVWQSTDFVAGADPAVKH